jgi:hypothetical protein
VTRSLVGCGRFLPSQSSFFSKAPEHSGIYIIRSLKLQQRCDTTFPVVRRGLGGHFTHQLSNPQWYLNCRHLPYPLMSFIQNFKHQPPPILFDPIKNPPISLTPQPPKDFAPLPVACGQALDRSLNQALSEMSLFQLLGCSRGNEVRSLMLLQTECV